MGAGGFGGMGGEAGDFGETPPMGGDMGGMPPVGNEPVPPPVPAGNEPVPPMESTKYKTNNTLVESWRKLDNYIQNKYNETKK